MSWASAALSEVADIVSGSTPKTGTPDYWDGHIPWVTPADLTKLGGHVISDTPRKLTEAGLASCGAKVLPVNSVLFSSRAPIGHVAITGTPMATNQGFKSFVPKEEVLDAKFLYWWLKSKKDYLQGLGVGATFKEVSKAIVAGVRIPLPPLPEQRRIAAILDQAHDLRTKRRRALTLIDELESALFRDFAHRNPDGPTSALRTLSKLITKGTTPTSVGLDFSSGGIPFIRAQDIGEGRVTVSDDTLFISEESHRLLRRSHIQPRDILVTIAGTIGRSGIVDASGPYNCNQAVAIVRLVDDVLPEYALAWLRSAETQQEIRRTSVTATISNFSLAALGNLRIPILSVNVQACFVEESLELSRTSSLERAHLAKLDELFASLQHRAFRGEL